MRLPASGSGDGAEVGNGMGRPRWGQCEVGGRLGSYHTLEMSRNSTKHTFVYNTVDSVDIELDVYLPE